MYVHIGKDYIIEEKNIISILDLENLLENKKIEDILKEGKANKENFCTTIEKLEKELFTDDNQAK